MKSESYLPGNGFPNKDTFRFIKPEEYASMGIDPEDVPIGTFPALKHPSHLPSRFGGNAYGSGLFEIYDRLKPEDIKLLQEVSFDHPEDLEKRYKVINRIYKKMGLLIRISSLGKPYYLIPAHLVSNTLYHIRARLEEISKVIEFHRKKFLKERYCVGLITLKDDLVFNELSYRFREHQFVLINSLERLRGMSDEIDLAIITRDIYELLLLEDFAPVTSKKPSGKLLDELAYYLIWKLYGILKPGGELFVIADRKIPKTDQTTLMTFKTEHEQKNFILFSHIFNTQKKYKMNGKAIQVNIFDLQEYLRGFYIEPEVIERVLKGRDLDTLTAEQINALPYLNYPLGQRPFNGAQERAWAKLLDVFFDRVFLKSITPQSVKAEWEKRFSLDEYEPHYLLLFLGQKKEPPPEAQQIKSRVAASSLSGSPFGLVADYRDSFKYVIETLTVVSGLKRQARKGYPELLIDRLRQPLFNRRRRHPRLGHVLKLLGKVPILKKLERYLNPANIEGPETKVLSNLTALWLFGFSEEELEELTLIVAGHTPMGRILSGKVSEKALQPLTDMARRLDTQRALNLLRYCRLMTLAELEASRGEMLSQEQLRELFGLYEAAVRIVMNRDMNWDQYLDAKISSLGGIRNEIMAKLLKMMNYYEFLDNWKDLKEKGPMEKEALADYDTAKLARIENVIQLVETVDMFEHKFLKDDPLELASFYRKLLNVEFHGTARVFSRISGRLIYILVWLITNVLHDETIINFNPVLARLAQDQIESHLEKIEREGRHINLDYLHLPFMRLLAEQLHNNETTFIVGTGFQLQVDHKARSVSLDYVELDKDITRLNSILDSMENSRLSDWPIQKIQELEELFFDIESFYQSHNALLSHAESKIRLPSKQKNRYEAISKLRDLLRDRTIQILFEPEFFYTHLQLLYHHAPSVLRFILPEFMALENLDLSSNLYLNYSLTQYILKCAKKLQALIQKDGPAFQDQLYLHQLAQREFGPMAAGTIGINEVQLEQLEKITDALKTNKILFNAFLIAFLSQEIGRVPQLREKYSSIINPADLAEAASIILEKENFAERFALDHDSFQYLKYLIRHHDLVYHIIRGETDFEALQYVIEPGDPLLLDALFLFSVIILSAIKEELIVEDSAQRLFRLRQICFEVLDGKTSFANELKKIYLHRGRLFHAVMRFQSLDHVPTHRDELDPDSFHINVKEEDCIRSGKMIFALERLFRLRGIRYIEFEDMARFMMKVPIRYIYKKRAFSSIGYPTFEKELFEAFRIYNTMQNLAEPVRHTILSYLCGDRIRLFGYEKVSGYLSYENQIKILLITLMASNKLNKEVEGPYILNFLPLSAKIDKRYEALNHFLNKLSVEKIWEDRHLVSHLLKAKKGLLLSKAHGDSVLNIDFRDRVDIEQKISYMETITNLDQLRNYYHYSLRSLRKYPFYTEDYERLLEEAYEKRMKIITEAMIKKFQEQMQMVTEFSELYNLMRGLVSRAYEIGFSAEQKQHIQDLYELRKEELIKDKLTEIRHTLESIQDKNELEDYWNSIKWYFLENRPVIGKEFEYIVAKQFDKKLESLH